MLVFAVGGPAWLEVDRKKGTVVRTASEISTTAPSVTLRAAKAGPWPVRNPFKDLNASRGAGMVTPCDLEAIMRKSLVLLPLALMAGSVWMAAESARIQIVLDVSGSMRSSLGSQVKIDAAKSAIRQTVAGLPEGSVVALRYYGHRVAQERKDESCRDTELVVQFQPLDKTRFLSALDQAVPRGQTPIAYSLQQAAQDFGAPSDEERAMILVSDGIETCGGDPLATVRDLTAKGFKVKVHTIGFDVDPAARAQLEAISSATGGEYFDARSASALADTLGKLTQRALLITRASAFGEEIRGGAKYDEAVAITPATTYHLDHHQRKNEYRLLRRRRARGPEDRGVDPGFREGHCHPRRQVRRGGLALYRHRHSRTRPAAHR